VLGSGIAGLAGFLARRLGIRMRCVLDPIARKYLSNPFAAWLMEGTRRSARNERPVLTLCVLLPDHNQIHNAIIEAHIELVVKDGQGGTIFN
jgi:hypothetical protein